MDFIHKEKERGKTILLSSHIFSEIDNTCDRIAIIKDGKIVSEFIADDLKHASRKYYSIDFTAKSDKDSFMKNAKTLESFILINEAEDSAYLSIEDKDLNKLIAYAADVNIRKFSNRKESLEDYFMKFYKEDKDFKGALK